MSAVGDCSKGVHGPIGEWDVSRVTDMHGIFSGAKSFNQDLSKWDVSRATNMQDMFANAFSFNQDLSKWDVSRVTNMDAMFYYARSFNHDLSKWDVLRVTNMPHMFYKTTSFNQKLCGAAWAKAWSDPKVNKNQMFQGSKGSISKTACTTTGSSKYVLPLLPSSVLGFRVRVRVRV